MNLLHRRGCPPYPPNISPGEPRKPLTTEATLLKFKEAFGKPTKIRRCPVYEKCLRSIATKRDGTDALGEGSGSAAVGSSAALGRKGEPVRGGEAGLGDSSQWTTTCGADPRAVCSIRPGATASARGGMGRYGEALAVTGELLQVGEYRTIEVRRTLVFLARAARPGPLCFWADARIRGSAQGA